MKRGSRVDILLVFSACSCTSVSTACLKGTQVFVFASHIGSRLMYGILEIASSMLTKGPMNPAAVAERLCSAADMASGDPGRTPGEGTDGRAAGGVAAGEVPPVGAPPVGAPEASSKDIDL